MTVIFVSTKGQRTFIEKVLIAEEANKRLELGVLKVDFLPLSSTDDSRLAIGGLQDDLDN